MIQIGIPKFHFAIVNFTPKDFCFAWIKVFPQDEPTERSSRLVASAILALDGSCGLVVQELNMEKVG